MKKQVLVIAVVAVLIEASGAAASVLPKVRSHGDPDEFQSRQVLDEGFAVRDFGPLPDAGEGEAPPQSEGCRTRSAKGREVKNIVSRSLSIDFSGKSVFLDR